MSRSDSYVNHTLSYAGWTAAEWEAMLVGWKNSAHWWHWWWGSIVWAFSHFKLMFLLSLSRWVDCLGAYLNATLVSSLQYRSIVSRQCVQKRLLRAWDLQGWTHLWHLEALSFPLPHGIRMWLIQLLVRKGVWMGVAMRVKLWTLSLVSSYFWCICSTFG